MLKITNLDKIFVVDQEQIPVLKDVNLDVDRGEFFSIIGPSGSGKSTLLRIIAGLIKPTSGTISWQEEPQIGFVFQDYALMPYLTVFENIEFGLKMKGIPKDIRKKEVLDLVARVGLEGFTDKHPKELSGGMKQRVGIARALAIKPNVLLLDEPFSSLDEITSADLRGLLLNLWQEKKMTVIMITHLIDEAIELSDRISILSHHPSTITKILENKLLRPRHPRSDKFFELEDQLKNLIQ